MSEYTDGQDSGLVLPEGYVAEQYEDGRLRIYDTATGGWLGEIAPHLANVQEVARDLITAHEEAENRRDDPTVLGSHDILAERSPAYGYGETRGNDAWDRRAENRESPEIRYGGSSPVPSDPKDAGLRIRELEIVASLAADSLEAAGDVATAEIVRSVLRNGSE